MSLLDLLIHALNFAAPAAFLAVLMPLLAKLIFRRQQALLAGWAQVLVNFTVCIAVLLAGLVFFGRDGKFATYAALVVCAATSQWMMARRWRKI
jgi:hypothetical protein